MQLSYEDLKVLSAALAQFVDNQVDPELDDCGETQEVVRARQLLDQVDAAIVEVLR